MRSIRELVALLCLACAPYAASATTYAAVFRPISGLGPVAPLTAAELAYRYEVTFDLAGSAKVALPGGAGSFTPDDTSVADYFYANVKTNILTFQPAPAVNDAANQFGVWVQHPNGNANVWNGGGFSYKTRLSLVSGSGNDYTTIDGFWSALLPIASVENMQRTDDMMWIIYDTSRFPNGAEFQGTYVATLESITAAVPEPSQLALFLAGICAVAFGSLKRRSASAQG